MMKSTHLLSGVVFAEAVLLYNGFSLETLQHPTLVAQAAPIAGLCAFSSIFPDIDLKIPGIAHRTITHWPIPYVLAVVASCWLSMSLALIFCLGCLLHLLLDACTPMGIPFLNPFGKKYSFHLVYVGSASEMLFIAAIFFGGIGMWKFFN